MPNDKPDWQRLGAQPVTHGQLTVTGVGGTATKTFSPPVGTLAVGVLVDNPAAQDVLATKLVGGTSGVNYSRFGSGFLSPTSAFNGNQSVYRFLVDFTVDTSFTFTLKSTGGTINAWLSALDDSTTVAVAADEITLVSSAGAPPAPWQAAANRVSFSASVAAASTAAILTPQPGVTFYLHSYSVSNDGANAAGNFSFVDTGGTFIEVWYANATRQVYATGDFKGVPLAIGLGVNIRNDGGAASFLAGALRYNQQ